MDSWEEHRVEMIEDLEADLRNESDTFWTYFLLVMLYGFTTLLVIWFANAWWLIFGLFMAGMTAVCFCCFMLTHRRMQDLRERIGKLELAGVPTTSFELDHPFEEDY